MVDGAYRNVFDDDPAAGERDLPGREEWFRCRAGQRQSRPTAEPRAADVAAEEIHEGSLALLAAWG